MSDYRKVQAGGVARREHIVVAERALGGPLPAGAEVHHVDENKQNNANSNLVICQDHAYHHFLHVRARIVRAGGNPNTDKVCSACRKAFHLSEFDNQTKGTFGKAARCKPCARTARRMAYGNKRRAA